MKNVESIGRNGSKKTAKRRQVQRDARYCQKLDDRLLRQGETAFVEQR